MMKTKKIYITGAYGGLGTDICDYFKELKYNIIKADYRVDINDRKKIIEDMSKAKPDIVIHLAAMVGTKDCEEVPDQAIKTNVSGTYNIASSAKKLNAKFIYFSTTAIYKPGIEPILENSKIEPFTIYGKTKLWGEEVAKETIPNNDLLIVRPCFGFGGRTDVSMLGALIKSHFTKKWINLLLDMNKRKDYTHVRNISYALRLMIENDAFGNDYNVSYGNAIEYRELISLLEKQNIHPLFYNFPERDYMSNHIVSNEKLVKDFRYKPLITLNEGIKLIINSYKK